MSSDLALARKNMVQSQVVPNRVTHPDLLAALRTLPRERFLDSAFQEYAYSDYPIPLGATGRHCLLPVQLAWMIQALESGQGDKILVVGAGTGYEATLLARMGRRVYALESDPLLAALGQEATAGTTVTWRVRDLKEGWPEVSPFGGILFCGSVTHIPAFCQQQMARDGTLVAIVGQPHASVMHAKRLSGSGGPEEILFETVATPLPGLEQPVAFEI
ncbi:MAG: protein-L-isoaspartate O-methyltransferase [Magnetococcales bacterium]|nr:protein-L-isoaspartate O-methyltransferase [Magnetococcales bacterium]